MLTQGYDNLNRITSLSFAFSGTQTFASSFSYDKAGRLLTRTYPNGITQTNTFDTAGEITGLSYDKGGSNLIALTYAYDRNGNKVSATDKGLFEWPTPTRIDETATYTAAGRLINRTDAASSGKNFSYTYDANGNMMVATGADQSFGFTYDEDNRVMTVAYSSPGALSDKNISNRYDALGRRISRAINSIESRYVLDLTGGMERILCDSDSTGLITAWYVHGPDLNYRVDLSGTLTCFHADGVGNIIRTTGSDGSTLYEYAYTPYGRSLGSVGAGTNPYKFVGSQGAMEELPNLYFMRARYYSAEAGVFLSTDPMKKIGPGWKPDPYMYAIGNPLAYSDPRGQYALTLGLQFSVNATFFGGVEWSSELGVAVETNALKALDVRRAFGIYVDSGVNATAGMEIGAGPGVEGRLSGRSSGYGVDTIAGGNYVVGTSNIEAVVGRASFDTDGNWSLGIGPKVKAGISVGGGPTGTAVFSLPSTDVASKNTNTITSSGGGSSGRINSSVTAQTVNAGNFAIQSNIVTANSTAAVINKSTPTYQPSSPSNTQKTSSVAAQIVNAVSRIVSSISRMFSSFFGRR